jgi:hypothetical protein
MERGKGVVPKAVAAMNCVNTAESNIHVRSVRALDYVVMIRCPLNVKTVMGRDFANMENGSLIAHYAMDHHCVFMVLKKDPVGLVEDLRSANTTISNLAAVNVEDLRYVRIIE